MVGLSGIVTEVASLFGEMSDEESFHDFGEGELDSDSDIDFDGLEPEATIWRTKTKKHSGQPS